MGTMIMAGAPMWAALALKICVMAIVGAYLWIAWQFYDATKNEITTGDHQKGKAAASEMVKIFVFCAMAGYLPKLLPIPWWVILLSHVILAIWAARYAMNRQAAHVAARLG